MRPLRTFAMVAFMGALLLALPVSTALFVEDHEFSTEIRAVAFDDFGDTGTTGDSLDLISAVSLLIGEARWQDETEGAWTFVATDTFSGDGMDRIEAFNVSALQDAKKNRRIPDRDAFQTFTGPNLTIAAATNSSLLVVADGSTARADCHAPLAISMPVILPDDLFDKTAIDFRLGRQLLAAGTGISCDLAHTSPTTNAGMFLLDDSSQLTIFDSAGDPNNFTGGLWIFRFHGTPAYKATGQVMVTPFSDNGTATIATYPKSDFAKRLSLDSLGRALDVLWTDSTQSPLTEETEQQIEGVLVEIGPIINGVILGNVSTQTLVNGKPFSSPGLAMIRSDEITMGSGTSNETLAVSGASPFILVGEELYSDKATARVGPVSMPAIAIFLWLVAIAAIVGGFVLKPFVGADQIRTFGLMRILALAFHVIALIIAFVLWDFEVREFLGISLLSVFEDGATGQGVGLAVAAIFQVTPFVGAWLFFALPVRFITNTALKLGGIKGGRGIGKGVGLLALWGLGAVYMTTILAGLAGAILSQAASGGLG